MRAKKIAILFGVSMPWQRKGSLRNRWGLFLHACGGIAVAWALTGHGAGSEYDYGSMCAGILFGALAGIGWEVAGWKIMRWPGNALDIIPWALGAGIFGVYRLASLGF